MLTLKIPDKRLWDETNEEFLYVKGAIINLEHSLVSISKWEMKWKKPFLGTQRNRAETIDYIRCMTISQNIDPEIYKYIDNASIAIVNEYINDSMTATWFSKKNEPKGGRAQVITNEIIYYWMIQLGIPFECQKWHLNRLLTLIRVCEQKNAPKKKMSKKDIYRQNAALNAQRRKMRGNGG